MKKDRKLLDYMQTLQCLECGSTPACGHHIKTKGSGGPDEPWNLVPLCHFCHAEIHRVGTYKFSLKSQKFKMYLEFWKWQLIDKCGIKKYIPPKL